VLSNQFGLPAPFYADNSWGARKRSMSLVKCTLPQIVQLDEFKVKGKEEKLTDGLSMAIVEALSIILSEV